MLVDLHVTWFSILNCKRFFTFVGNKYHLTLTRLRVHKICLVFIYRLVFYQTLINARVSIRFGLNVNIFFLVEGCVWIQLIWCVDLWEIGWYVVLLLRQFEMLLSSESTLLNECCDVLLTRDHHLKAVSAVTLLKFGQV